MNLVACDGTWQHQSTGEVLCSGTLQIVAGGGFLGLPPITYTEANAMLTAIALLLVSVFTIRQLRRVIR